MVTKYKVIGLSWLVCLTCVMTTSLVAQSRPAVTKPGSVAASEPKLKNIIVVYKTHFDIGYTALAKDVVQRYRTSMMDQTLKVIDQYKALPKHEQFVWTIPGWPMEQMLWAGQDPQRKERILAAIRAGNLAVHALPFTTHTETSEIEDLVRGLGHSAAVARANGLPLPRGAKTTDAPGQPWIFPTILHQAGIDFYHMGVNDATTPATTPLLFWWEGPDGSRLLTLKTNTYGTPPNPPRGWPFPVWIYIHMTYDNQGPPAPQTVRQDLAASRRDIRAPRSAWGSSRTSTMPSGNAI